WPAVLQHRRGRQADPPRRPLHRAPGFLQPDRQGQRGKHPPRPGPPDVLAQRRCAGFAHGGTPAQASASQGARSRRL
ncbi:MAG: SSU ribosomal protein S16p, partial [uncultured Ramlibacter sp.]